MKLPISSMASSVKSGSANERDDHPGLLDHDPLVGDRPGFAASAIAASARIRSRPAKEATLELQGRGLPRLHVEFLGVLVLIRQVRDDDVGIRQRAEADLTQQVEPIHGHTP